MVHTPPTHAPAPPAWLHTWPHVPQLFGSFERLISQPVEYFASQSAKLALHDPMAHFEETQAGVPLATVHAFEHLPQLFTSLVVLTSHPFAGFMSQSAVPATLHDDTTHEPFMQTSTEPEAPHACPHVPQFIVSLVRSISQPSDAILLQSAKPVLHDVTEQVDAMHDSTASFVLQGVEHDPQYPGLLVVFTHATFVPPSGGHSVGTVMSVHDMPQLVPLHVETPPVGFAQTLHELVPHELVDVLSRHVAAEPLPQLCVPEGHTQLPPWQTIPPLHACPHVPQLF